VQYLGIETASFNDEPIPALTWHYASVVLPLCSLSDAFSWVA